MERDFLGLNAKESSPAVKEESKEGSKDSAFMRGPGMQWAFSNKVSALPRLMSFKTMQEDRAKKIVFDPLSSAFMPAVSTADAASIVQKNFSLDRQVGAHNAVSTYAVQHFDAHRPHEVTALPVSNQTISVSMNNPFFKAHVATTGQSSAATTMKQQPFGVIPVTTSHAIFPANGSIDPRSISKPSGTQLTIFYGGSVIVYDDVSPEKAQAIMFLAGNGLTNQRSQVSVPTSKPAVVVEGVHGNQSQSTPPCSGLPSPISVTSHSGPQSGSGSSNSDEGMAGMAAKSKGTLTVPSSSQPEAPVMVTPISSAPTTLMPAAVPQARKASLARFLEKRKERIMTVAPYSPSNKSTESPTAGPLPFPASSKEQSWCLGPTKIETNNSKLHST